MGRVVASSSTTFSLCISSRASQSFTRPFNPNNRPQPKDGGGIKNIIYTLHTYVRTRLNGLYMKKKKRTRHSFDKHGQKSRGWWRNKLTAVSSVCAPLDTVLYCNTSHKPSRRGREKKNILQTDVYNQILRLSLEAQVYIYGRVCVIGIREYICTGQTLLSRLFDKEYQSI